MRVVLRLCVRRDSIAADSVVGAGVDRRRLDVAGTVHDECGCVDHVVTARRASTALPLVLPA